MDFNIFKMIYMSIIGLGIISIIIAALIIINNYFKEKNKIDMIKAKNDQYSIFMQMDPEAILSTIDSFIETYVKRYIVYKFVSKRVFIKLFLNSLLALSSAIFVTSFCIMSSLA